jgi:tellurite methyltransferase
MSRLMQIPHLRNHYSDLVLLFLKNHADELIADMPILDVGTGHMRNLKLFEMLGFKELYALDIDKTDNPLGVNYKSFIQRDITQGLPFENESFDIVLCNYVLMFIDPENMKFVVDELCRVSKKYILMETCRRKKLNTKTTNYTDYKFEEIVPLIPSDFEIVKVRYYYEKLIVRRRHG